MLARVMVLVAGLLLVVGLGLPVAALGAGDVNEAGCPNEGSPGFRAGLPDCRAYEMVTPPEKNSAEVRAIESPTVAADGSSLAGVSTEAFAGIEADSTRGGEYYRFTRTGSGWVTAPLDPYHGRLSSIGADDSIWQPAELPNFPRLWLHAADGSLSEIGPAWPPALGEGRKSPTDGYFAVVGAAAEATNGVLFTIGEPGFQWSFDSTFSGGSTLYEYKGTGNTVPSLVGVSGGAGSTVLVSQCGTELGGGSNAVSEDGGTVFFAVVGADRSACGGVQPPVSELFARIDGARTAAISEPSAADCPSCDTSVPMDATFRGASADGSKVFFTTTQPLLGHDTSENLYEYDFDPPAGEPKVVRVSGGDGSVSEPVAEVQRVTNVSEDGSHVYFIARGVLSTAANSAGERAQAGGENFYVYERDAEYPTGRTVFIAGCGDIGTSGEPANRGSQVTPDGRFLVFTSGCHLTTGDMSPARQVFQYDAQTNTMVRVSIGLEGYDDNGNSGDSDAGIVHQRGEVAARGGALARTMSDDGSYVFFQSPIDLTPLAVNGGVYEYHDGRVSLIAPEAGLVGTSASGGDVFFTTAEQLVPQDTDTQVDFYDARVDGGFPAPVVPAGCVGDACQGLPSAPPVFGAPSSAGFSGAGNLAPPVSAPVVVPKKGLTAAQKLSRALKRCLKESRRKRASCEARTRKLYGHSSKAEKSDRRGK